MKNKSKSQKEPATTATGSGELFSSSIADKLTQSKQCTPDFEAMNPEKLPEGATVVAGFQFDSIEAAEVIQALQSELTVAEDLNQAHYRALQALAAIYDRAVAHIEMLETTFAAEIPNAVRWAAILPQCIAYLKEAQ